MNAKTSASLLLSIIVSAAALYLAFLNVPLGELLTYLASINAIWIIPSVLALLLGFGLRALRWQIILAATRKISFWRLYHP